MCRVYMGVNKKQIYKWVFIFSVVMNVVTIGYFIDRKVVFGYLRDRQFQKQKWDALYSTKSDSQEIVFIGTSLTQGFLLRNTFDNNHLKNMGFGGLENEAILQVLKKVIIRKPPKIFLEAGINDLRHGRDMDKAYNSFVQMCTITRRLSPATKLYVQSVLPTLTPSLNLKIKAYNSRVAAYCLSNHLTYIDMYNSFLVDDKLNAMATTEGIHLTPYGYHLWKKQLEKYIAE